MNTDYTVGDYIIITATGRRAMVLEVSRSGLLVQPMTRNTKGYGKQVELPQMYVRKDEVSADTYEAKP